MNAPSSHAGRPPRLNRHLPVLLVGLAIAVGLVLIVRPVSHSTDHPSVTRGSGVSGAVERRLPPFTALELAGANDVVVHVGGRQRVIVRGDENLLGLVTTSVAGRRLVIGASESFSTVSPMRVDVSVPSLDALSLTGAGTLTVDGVETRALTASLDGSGTIAASGRAVRVVASAGGTGDLDLLGVRARDAEAVLAGTGRIRVYATRSVDARVPGTGTIVYGGQPARVHSSITGTGAVSPDG